MENLREIHVSELEQPGIVAKNASLSLLNNNIKRIKENEKIYYNQNEDERIKKKYYRKVNFHHEGKKLFIHFHNKLKKTHHNLVPYFISKDLYLYTWVDLQPDGTIKSIYSGEQKSPQQFLIEDFFTINERYAQFQTLMNTNKDELKIVKEMKSIDREYKFNTEHIVPQSWYHAEEPMKGDLHHLFACHPDCNTLRSNYPYGDHKFYNPESEKEPIRNHCGVSFEEYFEPEHGKGTVARAMFYFLVRYPDVLKKSVMKKINIPILQQWNSQFPVTTYEKHRNLAIYQIQGNRNPFIDYPMLANRIWGGSFKCIS